MIGNHALSIKGGGAGSDLAIQEYGGDSSGGRRMPWRPRGEPHHGIDRGILMGLGEMPFSGLIKHLNAPIAGIMSDLLGSSLDDAVQARRRLWEDRPGARSMRQARFRLRINEEIREADNVVGTKAQWESSSLAATSGWSVNIQRGHIVGMRLVGGQTYVPNNLDLELSGMRLA